MIISWRWARLFCPSEMRLVEMVRDDVASSPVGGCRRRKNVATGTVKWFSDKKGYGFIVPDEGGEDLFVHHSNILMDGFKTLQEGQKVDFEAGPGKKGPEAKDVRPA